MNEDKAPSTAPDASAPASTPAATALKSGSGNISLNLNAESLKRAGRGALHFLGRYAFLIVFITLTCVYAFLILRINTYSNPTVTDTDVEASDTPLPSLQIDEGAANKLQLLKDNSVNVQTLFEEGRTNPF